MCSARDGDILNYLHATAGNVSTDTRNVRSVDTKLNQYVSISIVSKLFPEVVGFYGSVHSSWISVYLWIMLPDAFLFGKT